MTSDFEIGRVVAVDTAQVTIELSADLRGLTRTTFEGPQEIGRINSYVVLPVGARRLVAMITRVVLAEEAHLAADRTMVTLPSARRLMKATLVGTIDGSSFAQGVAVFPILDNPVQLATAADLTTIFDKPTKDYPPAPDRPGFCVHLGQSAVFEQLSINIDPDSLFGKHAAILGSTGSGKSCTVAALLQSILERPEIRRTHVVILDTNGEYRAAFQRQVAETKWEDVGTSRCLYIPSDPQDTAQRLVIPYWFMNADDFVRLFRASQGVQRPVLLEALRLARNESAPRKAEDLLREELVHELNRIWSLSGKDEKTSKDVRDLAVGLIKRAADAELAPAWEAFAKRAKPLAKDDVLAALKVVKEEAEKNIEGPYPKILPADARKRIRGAIDPAYDALTGASLGALPEGPAISADTPAFFDKRRFRSRHLEQVLRREESGGARARDYSGTMLLRIDRLIDDRRFEFLLGPTAGQLPNAAHGLATFLRDVLGLPPRTAPTPPLSDAATVPPTSLPYCDRLRADSPAHNIVVVDLSLLAAEVLDNVTALIGRLILEALQRIGEFGRGEYRAALPVVLVLEEAQNYIREERQGEDASVARAVFERIAREGRKFGLGLVVSSQRPSELSRTVLSQCSSFIVHRLQNPEDLRYFREIVPGIYGPLLEQLPALAPQTALVLGECVRAPALVRIREARPTPRSRDPKFYAHWVDESPVDLPLEEVCALWAGQAKPAAEKVDPGGEAAAEPAGGQEAGSTDSKKK